MKYAVQSVDTQLVTSHKYYFSRQFSRIKTYQLNKTAQQNKISPPIEYWWPSKTKITQQNVQPNRTKIAHQNIDNPLDLASSWFSTLLSICITTRATVKLYLQTLYNVIHSVINDSYMQSNTFKKLQDDRMFTQLYVKWMFKFNRACPIRHLSQAAA